MAEVMSVAAYKNTIREVESPRDIERRILTRITGEMERHAAAYGAAATKSKRQGVLSRGLAAAISDNVKFWTAIRHELSHPSNQLPAELRAGLISLGLWVERECAAVLGGGGDVAALVSTNRAIAGGLAGRAPTPEAVPVSVEA
jgi:flagellar protein FlaF